MHSVVEEIIESNKWRDGEFAKFKTNPNSVEANLWFRMCIPMIYAHWEGFVVEALKTLLRHLNSLNIPHSDLKTNFIVIALDNNYKTLSGKQSFSQRISFTEKFTQLLQSTAEFALKVDTKSNLKGNAFKELCESFGFDYSQYTKNIPEIDRLVNIRNSIAHGENGIGVTQENIDKYITAVNETCDLFLIDIERFLQNKEYRSEIA